MTAMASTTPPVWRKILYSEQPFEDNYVHDSFLAQLRTNANVKEHDYWSMVRSAVAIAQQICAVMIFFSIFTHVHENTISVAVLGAVDIAIAAIGYAMLRRYQGIAVRITDALTSSFLFGATLSILSPVLRTLTKSYADDTIWALASCLAAVHLISHDYVYVNTGIGRFIGTISLNAAIFTAVLLGSRLQSNEHVFAFILFAIELFAGFPIVQREVKRKSERAHLVTALIFFVLSVLLTWEISGPLCLVSSGAAMFVTLVCPLWFMHVQEYKNEILGPWDIAHIQPEQ